MAQIKDGPRTSRVQRRERFHQANRASDEVAGMVLQTDDDTGFQEQWRQAVDGCLEFLDRCPVPTLNIDSADRSLRPSGPSR